MNPGLVYAALAFVCWGLYPLYLRVIASVSPLEVVLQRSLWSLVFVLALLAVLRRWAWLRALLAEPRRLALFAISALLLSVNWLVYVWAVQNAHVVEASLGYFINPLVNVLLGVAVLHERLRRVQWAAVALAAAGVAWMTVAGGRFPWIALVLACSFGLYGLMRKTASLGAIEGFAAETSSSGRHWRSSARTRWACAGCARPPCRRLDGGAQGVQSMTSGQSVWNHCPAGRSTRS